MNRSTCYVALESLHERGFVHISVDKSVREYVALSPDQFIETAEKEAKQKTRDS